MFFEAKICNTCKILKQPQEFYFRKQTGKLQGDCRICFQEKKKKYPRKYVAKKKKCVDCENLCDARKRIIRCYSCNNKFRWKDEEKKQKLIIQNKKMWEDETYRKKMSAQMKEQRKSSAFNQKLIDSFPKSNRLTKLHQKIKKYLKFEEHGFKSEQAIGKYFVDELNEERKIIIEINGNYIHANPKIYQPDSIIRIPGNAYTAAEKWESDRIKIESLTSMGYRVITIWESDNLEEVKKLLEV